MSYKNKLEDLVDELNSLCNDKDSKGHFTIRIREYNNRNYPSELQLSLMFIKKGIEYSPVEVISHTFALLTNMTIEKCYYHFYKELFRYMIFSTNNINEFIDFRGQIIKIQSISNWIIKG